MIIRLKSKFSSSFHGLLFDQINLLACTIMLVCLFGCFSLGLKSRTEKNS